MGNKILGYIGNTCVGCGKVRVMMKQPVRVVRPASSTHTGVGPDWLKTTVSRDIIHSLTHSLSFSARHVETARKNGVNSIFGCSDLLDSF